MGSFEMQGSVANRFEAGLTILDYTKAFTSAFDTNRLNPLGLLELRGGSVMLFGHPTSPISQSVAGLILPSDSNSLVQVDRGLGTQNIVLNLGPISQRLGGTLRFVLPAGTQSAVNGITTTTRNDLFTGLVGTLGAAATVTDGAGVTSFATRVGTNIVPVSAISRDAIAGILNGENITDVSGFTGTTLNVSAPITVRFGAAGTSVLSIPDGGILKVISGGILRTADAGVATVAVSGVSTTAGSASVTLASTAGLLAGMPVSGPGIPAGTRIVGVVDATNLLLSNAATATAASVSLNAGAITVIQGGTLSSPTRELIISSFTRDFAAGAVGDAESYYPVQRLVITSSIDGQQGITKTGDGTLVLRAGSQANSFSGQVRLQEGVLQLARSGRGSFAVGDSSSIVFSGAKSSVLQMLPDSVALPNATTTAGSTVVKAESTAGLTVGQPIIGLGLYSGTKVAALTLTGEYTYVGAIAISGATLVNTNNNVTLAAPVTLGGADTNVSSTFVTVASSAGLSVGMGVSGPGIPAGASIVSITGTSIELSVPATATATAVSLSAGGASGLVVGQTITGTGVQAGSRIQSIVGGATPSIFLSLPATNSATLALGAAAVTQVTTQVPHGIATGETVTFSGAGSGYNLTVLVAADPNNTNRFVYATPGAVAPVTIPETLTIDAGKRFLIDRLSFQSTTANYLQSPTFYGETVGSLQGGNRQTNSHYSLIDLGIGATLTANQTTNTTYNGSLVGSGTLRIIGNAELTLGNYSANHGDIVLDGGVLRIASANNGGGGRIYQVVTAGNTPAIKVNRFGVLFLDRTSVGAQETDSIGIVPIRLNSAAGTRGTLVTGSLFADTTPLGFFVTGTGADGRTENIGSINFESGTNYLSINTSGNRRNIVSALDFVRGTPPDGTLSPALSFATINVYGRPLASRNTGAAVNSSRLQITSGESTFISGMSGASGLDRTLTAGVTAAGSPVVTVTDTTGLVAGMAVAGTGIPAGSLVASVTSLTAFTLTANATATGSALTLTVYPRTQSIVPWGIGSSDYPLDGITSENAFGNSFLTYVAGQGLRDLSHTLDYATLATSAETNVNVREVLAADLTVAASRTLNSLVLHHNPVAGTSANFAFTGAAGSSLTTGSGAFLFTLSPLAAASADNAMALAGFDGGILLGFGAPKEYVFHVVNPGSSAITPRLTTTISAPLGSAGHLTKSGRGTLVLSGTNIAGGGVNTLTPLTYWGTTINEGVLAIGSLANIGGNAGPLTLAGGTLRLLPGFSDDISQRGVTFLSAGGTLDVGANDLVFANAIGGAVGVGIGGLTKAGTGSLTLAATSTFSGATTVANGTLVLGGGASNRLPTAAELFLGSGAGSASGVLQLGNANGASNQTVSSLSGVTGIQAADLTILNPGQAFTSAPIISFDAIGGLMGAQGAQAVATVLNGIITGITITDPGSYRPGFAPVVTVTGGAGNSASIVVRALGTVSNNALVGGSSAVSNLTVDQDIATVYNGAIGGVGANQNNIGLIKSGIGTLTLTGSTLSYVGQTTVLAGRLNLAGGQSAPLGTSSVKVNAGAILNFNNTVGQAVGLGAGVLDLGAGASGSASLGFDIGSLTAYDRISSTAAALAANRVIINLTGLTGLTAGSYDLLTAASGLAGATYSLGDLRTFGGHTFGLTSSDTAVTLTTTALPTDLYWRVGADVSWSSLDYANFDTNFSTDAAGTINAKGFPGIANNVIFSATPGVATDSYVATLDGNFTVGSVRFTSTPSGITSVIIAQGGPETTTALTITPANPADGIRIDANAGNILFSTPLVLGADQTWTIDGTGVNGSSLAVSGVIGGLAGNDLVINGLEGSTVVFSGLNTYAGTTRFPGLILRAGVANTFSPNSTHILATQGSTLGILRLDGFSNVLGGLGGVGIVENSNAVTAVTLTVGRNNESTNFAGEIRDGGLTALALTKVGTGALTLSGTNTFTGNTLVNGGVLNLTGSYIGATATSYLYYGNSPNQSTVNVSGDVDLFSMQGANTTGAVSVYNQTAGTVRLFTVQNGGNYRVATIGYGYLNLTGGLFQMSTGTGINRFNLNENSANAVGVAYVGGSGVLNNSNNPNDWFILAYQGLAQFTVGQGGFVNRQNSVGQIGLVLGGTGTQGTLNIAGGTFDAGLSNLR